MAPHGTTIRVKAAIAAAVIAIVVVAYALGRSADGAKSALAAATSDIAKGVSTSPPSGGVRGPLTTDSVDLSDSQLAYVKVEPVAEREFPIEKESVGSIDFNEEMTLQVFTPYQGRIIGLFAKVGDQVAEGATLFTIDSPDLLQASSTLIAAAGVLEFTTRNLARLKELYTSRAISQKDLEQATSDQQTAEGALRAARDSMRLFGKTDSEIDRTIADRRVDRTLIVKSPISGLITARNAAPGLFVQPGNAPAPYSVADITTMWMLANVAESDSPFFHVGQKVNVRVMAYPGRLFEGRISTIGASVDPNTHRVLLRSEIKDPNHELRSGMFATFVISIGDPVRSTAVPLDSVVREGDGTMTVWVTADRRRFTRRTVKIGLQHDGYRQIIEGVQPGELVATEGALFLSNALTASRS
jgi:cobalt-zinc-cadmium efflux system membrane fusion protein